MGAFSNDFSFDFDVARLNATIGGVGHYKYELELARQLAAITKRGPPGFVDLRSPVQFPAFGGPQSAPFAQGALALPISTLPTTAQVQAAQAAAKRKRDIEAILLLAV